MNRVMNGMGRLLLAGLFMAGAVQKIFDPGVVIGLLQGFGLPGFLVWPAAVFNIGAAAALISGYNLRILAPLMAAYCGFTSLFHLIPHDPWQISIFVKNWSIAGGLLVLASQPAPQDDTTRQGVPLGGDPKFAVRK
jgi:putative oxidoreductase